MSGLAEEIEARLKVHRFANGITQMAITKKEIHQLGRRNTPLPLGDRLAHAFDELRHERLLARIGQSGHADILERRLRRAAGPLPERGPQDRVLALLGR